MPLPIPHENPDLSDEAQNLVEQGGTPFTKLRQQLQDQHPIHDEFAMAYQNLNGVVGLTDWGEQNKTEFYKLFAKLAPTPENVRHSGGIEIKLTLERGPLDV